MGAFTGQGVFVNNGMYLYIASLLSVGYAEGRIHKRSSDNLKTYLRTKSDDNVMTISRNILQRQSE